MNKEVLWDRTEENRLRAENARLREVLEKLTTGWECMARYVAEGRAALAEKEGGK